MTGIIAPSKSLLQVFIDAGEIMQHGIIWLNEEGHILHANTQLIRELGYSREAFSTKTIFQVSPYLNFIRWRELWKELHDDGQIEIELEHITTNGTILPMKLRGIMLDAGDQRVCCGILENRLMVTPYIDLLQMLSELLNAGAWQWTITNDTYFLTQEMYRVLEVPEDFKLTAANAKTFLANHLSQDEYFKFKEKIEDCIENGQPFEGEICILLPSSPEPKQFWARAVPYQMDGQTIKIYGTLQDVSKISQRTEEMYLTQYSVENATEIIYWLKPDGSFLYVNNQMCKTLDYKRENLLKQKIWNVRADFEEEVWITRWEVLRKHKTVELELKFIRQDGSHVPIQVIANLLNYKGQEIMCVFGRDVSEQRRLTETIEAAQYSLNQANEMIYWLDLDGTFKYFNDTFCKKLGYTRAEIQEMKLTDFFPDYSEADFQEAWETAFKEETLIEERVITGKNDIRIPVETHVSLGTYEGQTAVFGILTDISERKKKEEQLQQLDKTLGQMRYSLNHASEAMYWLDRVGNFVFVNDAFCKKLGYTTEEALQLNVAKVYPDYTARLADGWEKLERKEVLTGEYFVQTKQGKRLLVGVTESLVVSEDKVYCCGILYDISAKIGKETEIQQIDQMLELTRRTLNQIGSMVYWTRPDGSFCYVNDLFCEKVEHSHEELMQMNLVDFFPGSTKADFQAGWERLRQGEVLGQEILITLKNGRQFPIKPNVTLSYFEGEECACATAVDLTEHKQVEEAYQHHAKMLEWSRYSLNQSHEMIYWQDENKKFLHVNDFMCKSLGYKREELLQLKVTDLFKDATAEEYLTSWKDLLEKGAIRRQELMIYRKNGTSFPVECSVTLVKFDDEQGACGVLTDISERKQKAEELHRAFDEIKRLKDELESDNRILKDEIDIEFNFSHIISRATSYKKVLKQIDQVADTDATVLILGETGTGKELLARALHQAGSRADRPMVKINCAALPENLIESELFGHEKGAFTGAYQQKKGRFELANKGTIFLDEIGELQLDLQTKLLRVLQEGEFERVGGSQTIKVDVRVVAATNRDLEELVQEGKFRQDLFYRLNVFPIYNIPLRERRDDIPLMVKHFIEKFTQKSKGGKRELDISQSTMDRLMQYDYPGNVRELENIIERAVILSNDNTLRIDASFFQTQKSNANGNFKTLEEMQREYILEALRRTNGQVSGDFGAAKLLDINDKTLASRMKKLDITRMDYLSE